MVVSCFLQDIRDIRGSLALHEDMTMARLPRYFVAAVPLHIILRGIIVHRSSPRTRISSFSGTHYWTLPHAMTWQSMRTSS
jgi:hypothetical protein